MAFHPYPQLIPQFFNIGGFGPPRGFTLASSWPWIDHSVSGLYNVTCRPIQTRFRCGSGIYFLNLATSYNSPVHSTKGTPSGIVSSEDKTIALRLLVGIRFQVLFHYPPGVLFTFPSRYLFTIGCQLVFSLRRWSSRIPTEFHGFRGTQEFKPERFRVFAYGAITLYGAPFQLASANTKFCNSPSLPIQAPLKPYNPPPATQLGFNTGEV